LFAYMHVLSSNTRFFRASVVTGMFVLVV
jgi:hypothetical protein